MSRRSTTAAANGNGKAETRRIRCAIYTRKSSEEGLDQEFNSLDAQREGAEAFIASQKAEGWTCLPERYDDGGFSGGSMERPALARLLRDIQSGGIDCVVVYKVDRLSRSLLDFSRIMETFEKHGVSFVSVTQQFNTTHSMGRLTLNILLSFAQFEREIIGERIRDKVAAQKRKGKWAGGVPVLGYDVDRNGPSPRLVINAREAARVRDIFALYLEKGSLQPVVSELTRRGWVNKRRLTKKGQTLGGRPFDKATLHVFLTNPILAGNIVHKCEVYEGEHDAIIDQVVFDQVQSLLKTNGRTGGAEVRNKYGALLRGLLKCKGCGHAMTHTFSSARKGRFYRYYRCVRAIKSGAQVCESGTLPAAEIERVVVDEVRALATDKAHLAEVLAKAQASVAGEQSTLATERDDLKGELRRQHQELRRLVKDGRTDRETTARIAELNDRIRSGDQRLRELDARIVELERETITRAEAEAAFADFDGLWANLSPREQARMLNLLIAAVEYDAKVGSVSVTFRPTSIGALARRRREQAA
ncbi:MAG: recombinase family protein [Phycisphaerales bacterium]|nr:recombinase family protein [Phycisphaerales bacterium]